VQGLENYRRAVVDSKRAAILKAARRIFLKCGYTSAGMTKIAGDADVSTATLYKHFGSKEELFAAVVTEAARFFRQEFATPPQDATLAEKFATSVRLVLLSYAQSDLHVLMRVVIAEVPFAPDVARSMYANMIDRWHKGVALLLDRLVEEGELRPHDTQLSAKFLAGMVKEAFIWPGLFDANYVVPQNPEATIRELAEFFLTRYAADRKTAATA
jgi:TetR/AcrR family transcriptional regulator of autoinduction and epiphytic fitness